MEAAAARSSVPTSGELVAERYRIGRVLGEGGMGVVLQALDESTGEEVALKLLQAVGQTNTERFLREARLVSRIESEHVVRVFDMGSYEGYPFIVMERLHGKDFGAKLRSKPLGLTEVADCVVQTCEALAHAHGAGIVHRDIKASNLFECVADDGGTIVKVLDFGISKTFARAPEIVEHTVTRTTDVAFVGSPPYMSPEHIRDPRNVDGRSDLWSLGVVAFRLLTTHFPFDGQSTAEIVGAILERRVPHLRDVGVEVPEGVEQIIQRCLSRAREQRYQDAGALAEAFSRFASPRWASYGRTVPEIVAAGTIPPPQGSGPEIPPLAVPGKKKLDPTTRTVAPPVRLGQDADLHDAQGVPTAILAGPVHSSSVPPPLVEPGDATLAYGPTVALGDPGFIPPVDHPRVLVQNAVPAHYADPSTRPVAASAGYAAERPRASAATSTGRRASGSGRMLWLSVLTLGAVLAIVFAFTLHRERGPAGAEPDPRPSFVQAHPLPPLPRSGEPVSVLTTPTPVPTPTPTPVIGTGDVAQAPGAMPPLAPVPPAQAQAQGAPQAPPQSPPTVAPLRTRFRPPGRHHGPVANPPPPPPPVAAPAPAPAAPPSPAGTTPAELQPNPYAKH